MTTYSDSKQETLNSLQITQTLEELNSTSEISYTIDVGQQATKATKPTKPTTVSDNPETYDDRWEEEIDLLAATQYYSNWMSLEHISMIEDIRPDVSEEILQLMMDQELSMDEDFISDELLSRAATLSETKSHELFGLMSYLQDQRQR
jgi:hypothetical protein